MTTNEEAIGRLLTGGVNTLKGAGARGIVYWTVTDVHDANDGDEFTDEEARNILESVNSRITDAMVERGWDVLNQEVSEYIREKAS